MKHIFVINPIAGKGKAISFENKIKDLFKNIDEPYEILITKESGEATKKVKDIVSKERCRVYSIGGDGTLNEVLNGLVGSDSSLAIIPAGSGNDFARTLYGNLEVCGILEKLISGEEKPIDVAKVNDRYFLNISSVGFDACVVNNARQYKKYKLITGPMAYGISLIKTLFTFGHMNLEFEIDDKIIKSDMYLIAVANGKCYGGGIKIAPNAIIDDGLLDIYAIKKPRLHRLIRFLPKVVTGKDVTGIEEIIYTRIKKMRVKSKDDIIVNIDGEIVALNDINFEIVNKAINVVIPREEIELSNK